MAFSRRQIGLNSGHATKRVDDLSVALFNHFQTSTDGSQFRLRMNKDLVALGKGAVGVFQLVR